MTQSELIRPEEIPQNLRRRSYRAILELSARHPLLDSRDLALLTGASQPWIKSVMKSDTFIAQRAVMVDKLHGARLREIQAKLETTTSLIIDAIGRRIADPEAAVSEDTLIKAFIALADRVLPKKESAPAVNPGNPQPNQTTQFIFNGVTMEDIQRARDAAMNRGRTIELEPQEHVKELVHVDEDGIPTAGRVRSNEGCD